MKIFEIITEAREAPLYHGMDSKKALAVFSNDILPAQWTHNIPAMGKVTGNSFSRNKLLKYAYVVITVDQHRLSQTNKIIPLDGEYVHRAIDGTPSPSKSARDRNAIDVYGQKKKPKHLLSEEFVVGDIKPLHKYIIGIKISEPDFGSELLNKSKLLQVTKFCREYAEKWNIPFN